MASTRVSPSSVTTRRTVPCIAGCEGPRLMVISEVGRSCSTDSGSCSCAGSISVIRARVDVLPADVRLAHGNARSAGTRPGAADKIGKIQLRHQGLPLAHRVVLAQRVPLELGIEKEPLQVGMAGELDPEHVVGVA